MRFLKFVFLGLLVSAFAYAQEPSNGQGGSEVKPDSEIGVSEPDLHFLKRMRTFRGPYTDQDDPLLTAKQAKEADRTGVTAAELTCRPPHCSREDALLIVKLATSASSQILAKTPNNGTKQSAFYVDSALTPIFSQALVSKARAKYAASSTKQPVNSLGKPVDLSRWHSLSLPKGTNLDEAIKDLSLDPRIEVVESSFERQLKGEPTEKGAETEVAGLAIVANDPRKAEQWALERTRTEDAWQWLEDNGYPAWGDRNIVVAVIDSGVDYTHEDLAGNMWVNAGEIPDNNIDDDNNGFIDDVYGADVVGSTYDHDGDPQDDNGHGTHVAGIIAAQGNNDIGIIGVAPNSQIMAIKAAQYSGVLTSTDIAEAILYAYQQGADIINMSFGGSGRSVLEEEALAVAFSNAVLIAAAGNSGIYNDTNCGPFARPSYPGAYPYVLGVMAERQLVADNGDWLASFSNWDCKAKNSLEYEVMAPGVDILSTIPGNGYAAWDGTSMAAPVVAGIAALVRTRFEDKSVYSSRFIMGQLASTGGAKQSITPCTTCFPLVNFSSDSLQALVNTPKPSLSYLSHFLWDEEDLSSKNDDDGIVDSGETIEVGLTIKNVWGQADNVVVTLSAQAQQGEGVDIADPYVTFNSDSVSYGSTGSFAQDDNGYVYENDLLVGVDAPFSFTVADNAPNEHIIPMLVSITATNGLDDNDTSTYEFESRFSLIVQSGRELPRVIDSDAPGSPGGQIDTDGVENGVVTIDNSALWLIDNPVLVAEETTLKVGPGAILQFWGTQPDDAYAVFENSYLQVEGSLDIEGTESSPVTLKPSDLFDNRGVVIDNRGSVSISYAKLSNLSAQNSAVAGVKNKPFERIDHSRLTRLNPENRIATYRTDDGYFQSNGSPSFAAKVISNSRLSRLAREEGYARYEDGQLRSANTVSFTVDTEESAYRGSPSWSDVTSSLIENTAMSGEYPKSLRNSVVLSPNQQYVNRYGDTVTVGSRLELGGYQSNELQIVADVLQYDEKSYVLLWKGHPGMPGYENNFDKHFRQIKRSREFAQSLNGDLVVYSSDAEQTTIANHYKTFWDAASSVAALSDVTTICTDSPEICEKIVSNKFDWWYGVVIGITNTSGQWGWVTGESPSLSADPLDQALPDPVAEKVPYLFQGLGSLSSDYVQTIGQWSDLPFVLLEIPGAYTREEMQAEAASWRAESASSSSITASAVLNPLWDANPSNWLVSEALDKFDLSDTFDVNNTLQSVYWGTDNPDMVEFALKGNARDFNKLKIESRPLATSAPESAYPFVASLKIADGDGVTRAGNVFAAETTVWDVIFNRDMNTSVQPMATFGPDVPYTDFSVSGDWIDARTWRGQVNISPVTTDGYQYVRVAGAVAADDPWLVTGDDKRRFRFEVITSGTESLNLQASGGEGYVDLSWNQDDYDTLMGFNIYRSTSQDGNYVRINQTLVGNEDREYRDSNTEPGVQYFYYFTVALDGSESEPSNKASATPIDTVKPVMSHNIISTATFGSTVMVQANVTDNISVQSVTLYYRAIGDTSYTSADMVNTSGSTYRASIPASATQPPGVEYYIAASDGSSYTYSGRASSPNKITIENNPVVTSVSPSAGSTAGGEVITVSGNNFVDGATVALGSATCQNVVWASESRLTCTTPASAPNLVAVTVENPDGGKGVLTSGFTFVGNSTTIALPDITASQGQTRDVALTVDPVSGMQSFTAVISWNGDHLQYAGFTKGALVSGWDVVSQLDGTTLTVAGSSSTSVSGSGELVLLEFGVVADGDVSSVIDLVSAKINEGYIETALVDGSFSTAAGFSVSGRVRFWDASNTAVAATVTLDNTFEEVSDEATGQFQFSGVLDGTHTLNIEKEDGINDSVRGYDASLILSHVVGSATLTGSALAAADVTGNGEISALDASKVLEVAAGLETVPFANQVSAWAFEPAERRYDEITSNITNADFTAIFMGDVSGNWGDLSTQSLTGVRLELDSVTREGIATVNVLAAPPVEGVAISSVELTLNTTAGVSLIQASRTPATTNWSEPLVTVGDNAFSAIIYDDVSGAFSTETHVLSLELSLINGQQAVTSLGGWLNEMQLYSSEAFALKSANDTDGDFVDDDEDAFPNDPSASTDTDGDGLPDDWNPGYTALDSTTGLLVDRDDDNDGYTDKEEEEAGTDSLDAGDQPVSGMGIILIKQAIDAAAARSQQ
jgi:subtilisin family serine protease